MFAPLIKNLCEIGSINPRKRNRRKTRTDEADEVAILGAVANNSLILVLDKLKVILEFLKQVHTAFLNVISFSPTTYRNTRNCMGTIFKIVYNFVDGTATIADRSNIFPKCCS
jgi:hypothetical protein